MAEKNVHKVYGSFPPWGKSVEFPAGGGGNYVYYSGGVNDFQESIALISILKVIDSYGINFIPMGVAVGDTSFNFENVIGAGFDLSMKMTHFALGELVTIGELIAEASKNWTQITEEEFYDTNLGNESPE